MNKTKTTITVNEPLENEENVFFIGPENKNSDWEKVKHGRPHGSMNRDTSAKLDTLYTLIVARYMPPFYRCPSVATLAEECGCSTYAIRLRIAHLVQDGRLVKGPDGRVAPAATADRIDAAFQKLKEG